MPAWNRVDSGHRRSDRRWPVLYRLGRGRSWGSPTRISRGALPRVRARLPAGFQLAGGPAGAGDRGGVWPRWPRRAMAAPPGGIGRTWRPGESWPTCAWRSPTPRRPPPRGRYPSPPPRSSINWSASPSPDGVAGDYTVDLSAEPYRANVVSASFNGGTQVVFNGWGLPNSGGTVVLSVGAEQRTVVVDGTTGGISIQ